MIDGTLWGLDHLAELVVFRLHRLGVAQAELVVLISDGACWNWDRLEWIERRVGLDSRKTVHALSLCFAAHHVSLTLSHLGFATKAFRFVPLRFHRDIANDSVLEFELGPGRSNEASPPFARRLKALQRVLERLMQPFIANPPARET